MDNPKALKEKLENGATFEEVLVYLRENNVSPVETIKAIKEVKNISLGEAKELFVDSKAWHDVAVEADKMHQDIIDAIEKDFYKENTKTTKSTTVQCVILKEKPNENS